MFMRIYEVCSKCDISKNINKTDLPRVWCCVCLCLCAFGDILKRSEDDFLIFHVDSHSQFHTQLGESVLFFRYLSLATLLFWSVFTNRT